MIPVTIIPYVFQQLNDRELLQVSLVCRQWYQLTFDPLLGPQWQGVNFQEKLQGLLSKYVKESGIITSRLRKEKEKMDWKRVYETVLKRSQNHLRYLRLWSCFSEKQLTILMENPTFNQLMILDLRGTDFDITNLFKPQTENDKVTVESKMLKSKEIETNSENNESKKQKETIINNDKNDNSSNENNKNGDNNTTIREDVRNDNKNEHEKSSSSSSSSSTTASNETNKFISLIDFFPNLKYFYIRGCKNVTEETVTVLTKSWPHLLLDVKICDTCHSLTRKCRDQALNNDPQHALETSSQCHVCQKEHCDQCRPLWTCYVCGGDYTCEDCRAHGLKCTTCDVDFCYTCQQPKKVLECRYCHRMSCGQSAICQNQLGTNYKMCDKCEYFVCSTCHHEEHRLIVCSGSHCSRTFCKTCTKESTTPSLISFDKSEVEQRIRENGFGICSYCNKLYCQNCLVHNLSFYGGNSEFPFPIILCTDCELYYKTQLLNLFKTTSLPSTSSSTSSLSSNNNSLNSNNTTSTITGRSPSTYTGRTPSTYTNNLLVLTSTSNLLSTNSLSLDSPIDIFNDDHYIR